MLSRFKNPDSHRLMEVVTGDDTWLYFFFDPDNKLNNKMWVGENNEHPMVAHRSRSVRRVIYAVFFDSNCLAHVSVPENCSVTGTFYPDFVLSAVVNHYQAKCPRVGVRGIKLLHDNISLISSQSFTAVGQKPKEKQCVVHIFSQ